MINIAEQFPKLKFIVDTTNKEISVIVPITDYMDLIYQFLEEDYNDRGSVEIISADEMIELLTRIIKLKTWQDTE